MMFAPDSLALRMRAMCLSIIDSLSPVQKACVSATVTVSM